MSGPIVPLPILEQIVPEHCCPLWGKQNILWESYKYIYKHEGEIQVK